VRVWTMEMGRCSVSTWVTAATKRTTFGYRFDIAWVSRLFL
jgi:hypothetical protein